MILLPKKLLDAATEAKVSTVESILEDLLYDDRSKVIHHELLPEKHKYPSKTVEFGKESKIDKETPPSTNKTSLH